MFANYDKNDVGYNHGTDTAEHNNEKEGNDDDDGNGNRPKVQSCYPCFVCVSLQ